MRYAHSSFYREIEVVYSQIHLIRDLESEFQDVNNYKVFEKCSLPFEMRVLPN